MEDSTFVKIFIAVPFFLWGITCRQSWKDRIKSWPGWAVLPICTAVEYYALLPDPSPVQTGVTEYLSAIFKVVLIFAPFVIFMRWLGRYQLFVLIGNVITWPFRKFYNVKREAFRKGYDPSGKKSKEEIERVQKIASSITGITFSPEDDLKRLGGLVYKEDESVIKKVAEVGVSIYENTGKSKDSSGGDPKTPESSHIKSK